MPLNRLDHYSIRTTHLAETQRFYTDVLGLEVGPRPNFPFPGVWLYHGGVAVVHVVGIDPNDPSGLQDYLGDKAGAEAPTPEPAPSTTSPSSAATWRQCGRSSAASASHTATARCRR